MNGILVSLQQGTKLLFKLQKTIKRELNMKNITSIITLSLLILFSAGCSIYGGGKIDEVDVPKTTAITKQKLSTFFEDDGLRINWECVERNNRTLNLTCSENIIESIEATITLPSYGGTNANGASAIQVGQLESIAMIARFIEEEIVTERVVALMADNVERADDTYRNAIAGSSPPVVGISSKESQVLKDPNPNMNFAVRTNINNTVRELNTEARGNAQAIMHGVAFEINQKDDQLIQIKAIWQRARADSIRSIAQYFE